MTERSAAAPAVLAIATAAVLSVVWWHPHFPTGDGPSHLYNAEIIRQALSGAGRQLDYFEVSFLPYPNWIGHAVLAILLGVASPPLAERILVTGYFVGWALALGVFLDSTCVRFVAAAILGMALSIHLPLMLGFYNFSIGLVIYLLTLGLWLRGAGRSRGGAALLGLLLVIGYFSHPMTLVLAWAAIVWTWLADPLRRNEDLLRLAAASVPAIALAGWYLIYGIGAHGDAVTPAAAHVAVRWWKRASDFDCLWYGDRSQHHVAWLCVGAWLLMLVSSLARTSGALDERRRALLWFSLALFFLAVVAPEKAGGHGGYLVPRLVLIGLVTSLGGLGLAAGVWPRRSLLVVASVASIASLGMLARYETRANREIAAYLAGLPSFGRGRVFIPLVERGSPFRVDPLAHTSSFYAIAGDNVDLGNYEADLYYFAVRFRRDAPRPADVPTLQTAFATLDLERVASSTDALLVWGAVPPVVNESAAFRPAWHEGRLSIFESNRRLGEPSESSEH